MRPLALRTIGSDVTDERRGDVTVVGPSRTEHALIWIGFPLAGVAVGWLVKVAAVWIATVAWLPLPGRGRAVVELADRAPNATLVALGLGVVLGVVVAVLARADQVTVTVRDDHLRLQRGEADHGVERSAIAAVFLDGKQLVIQGDRGDELLREATDLHADALEGAFRTHGIPWTATDPRGHELRRWVPDLDGLPAGADPLLVARRQALKDDETDDAAQLRGELAKLGIVVRDEDGARQFVRPIDPEPTTAGEG